MGQGSYRVVGRGSDLGIEVEGPDLAACLEAAVEAFAAGLVDLPVEAPTRREAVAFDEDSPAALLVALVDECVVRLDADGELAVALEVEAAEDGRLRGALVLCPLSEVAVHGVAPKAATWHGVRLEPADGGWSGAVMIDL